MIDAPQEGRYTHVDALARLPDATVLIVDDADYDKAAALFPQNPVLGVIGIPAPHGLLKARSVMVWCQSRKAVCHAVFQESSKVKYPAVEQLIGQVAPQNARLVLREASITYVPTGDEPAAPVRQRAAMAEQGLAQADAARKHLKRANGDARAVTAKGNPVRRTVEKPSWNTLELVLSEKGLPVASLDNCVRVLERHAELQGHLWYDVFLQRILHTWGSDEAREWIDYDDVRLALMLQREVGIPKVPVRMAHDAVTAYARRETRNCAFDWLDSLQWDGIPRLEFVATKAFGAEYNDYTVAVCRNFFLAMVKRVFEPGCKSDYMPVFEGAQGVGKSRALAIIGGAWFAESHESILSKDFFGVLEGKLVIEISEMHAFRQADVDRIKGIVSCANDRYRVPYDTRAGDHPRQCVFAGTTNRDDWNRDDTGARRFWPIRCGQIDHAWLTEWREQLFAEAVHAIRDGQTHWEVPWELAGVAQEDRRQMDVWEEEFEHYVTHSPSWGDPTKPAGVAIWTTRNKPLDEVTISEFLIDGLGFLPLRISRSDEMRAAKAIKATGWNKVRANVGGKRRWCYRPDLTIK